MRRTKLGLMLLVASLWLTDAINAADIVKRIDERYAAETVTETPNFRQDVVPLLGKLGCNGRACHGSFQGQGGFRLSLFGYDFKSDHENLTQGDKPRVNLSSPVDSLMLQKPLEQVSHEGGQRLTEGSWQHRVLKRWIESGAKSSESDSPDFVRLEVTPHEIVATTSGEKFPLNVVVVWSNGVHQDVTPLCRFRTNNDQIATIDETGLVTSAGPGDSHVVVFYDNGVVPVPIIQPVSDQIGEKYPAVPTPTKIDELVVQKLRKLGMIQSDICTDAEFLRRVSLDIAGTLPTPVEVESFLADTSSDKRSKKIDELLERPAYSAWWATRFSDWTGNNASKLKDNKSGIDQNTKALEWYEWLRTRIEKNVPYDQIAEGIILAVSRLDEENYAAYCERMSAYHFKDAKGSFADQPSLTHYWARRDGQKPEERALSFAYTFLGLRIQCAQCHKHPFDQWTKDDFERFSAFFGRVRNGNAPGTKDEETAMLEKAGIDVKKLKGNDIGKEIRKRLDKSEVMPFDELFILAAAKKPAQAANPKNANKKRPQVVAGRTAKILGGDEVVIGDMPDPREALMDWLRDDHNPYFARSIVNRIWSGYFNAGIVDPIDDLSLANPPSNEALLDYLATEFRQHGYDLKWLHRTIANSRTYQLSWQPNKSNELDERNFARAVPRRLPAEVAFDAVQIATMSDGSAAKWQQSNKGRAIANPVVNARSNRGSDYALSVFGRSTRESNCECDRSSEVSLLQTVFLHNDNDVLTMISGKGRWVEEVVQRSDSMTSTPSAADRAADESGKNRPRLAQVSLTQLKKRLEAVKQKGNKKAIDAIEKEIAAREEQDLKKVEPESASKHQPSGPEVKTIIRQAYLRTLNRYPTEAEVDRATRYYDEVADLTVGTRDLLWALVNTKEFVVNH